MSKTFSASEVKMHNTDDDLYIIINKKVYDVSKYSQHPGGKRILLFSGGKDCTDEFKNYHLDGKKATDQLKDFYIGDLKKGSCCTIL